jgi:hypothetical protein
MAARKDEGPVQDLGANGPHPALGESVGLRSADGREDHPGTLGSEHGVEGARELGVSIADEVPNSCGNLTGHVDVASLLGGVAGVGVAGRGHHVDPTGPDLDEEQDVQLERNAVSTEKKSQARTPSAWARRNSDQEGPSLRGAGPKRFRLSSVRMVVAPTRMPRPRSSPWIRTHPQRGFSLARRRISSRTRGDIGGRPTRLARYVHLRLTRSRCQRRSVAGVTRNDDRRSRGSIPAAADKKTLSNRRSLGRPLPR